MTITFILNGEDVSVRATSGDRLVDILREDFGLLAAKADCRKGTCGKCLVLLDGKLVPSCMVPAFKIRGREVITFEGFVQTVEYEDIRQGVEEAGLETCGFCESGLLLALGSLLESSARPSREEVLEAISSVQCRCTDPETTITAALSAADRRARRTYRRGRQ
ncbi:MAG TPA: 2Fe-2S iron-sulfur cluster-binding protein [Rectinemataceae bacterium]|nr:2Fe-2S iron-sulfur cluster-binding protein [Rectinemataceae bacterium]